VARKKKRKKKNREKPHKHSGKKTANLPPTNILEKICIPFIVLYKSYYPLLKH
jgi:hypothetical protein